MTTWSNITDNGLLYSNIAGSEVSLGTTNSMLSDAFSPAATTDSFGNAVSGLTWRGFVAGATGGGGIESKLSVNLSYDISSTDPTQGISSVRLHSFTPDFASGATFPAGARFAVRQEVYDSTGTVLLAHSTLRLDASTNDRADDIVNAEGTDSLVLSGGPQASVKVKIFIEVEVDADAAAGTRLSFSALRQNYDDGDLPAALGDYVFHDLNADGIQEDGEAGIAGATVELLSADGLTVLDTDTTDGDGRYDFTGLAAGDYKVRFVSPTGFDGSSPANAGADGVDSDALAGGVTATVNLTAGETDNSVDAGFFRKAALGNFVFEDLDADGVRDAGEAGIANVTVELLDATGTTVLGTDVTDGNGFYDFTGLTPGDYKVRFVTPGGYESSAADQGGDDETDSDAGVGGVTGTVTLTSGETDNSIDAGFYRLASIGDRVWLDDNGDGIQNDGELGAAGVTVRLLNAAGDTVLDTTVTGANGEYLFDALTPGSYRVEFVSPDDDLVFTLQNQGADAADSDADPATGRTGIYVLESGDNEITVDAGLEAPSTSNNAVPGIDVVKTTSGSVNGAQSDSPAILQGSAVWWTYAVTNTSTNGSVPLTLASLVDDNGTPDDLGDDFDIDMGDFVGGDANGNTLFDNGETWIFKVAGIASVNGYVNEVSVSADYAAGVIDDDDLGGTLTDTDISGYTVLLPGVDIEKEVSVDGGTTWFDADLPTGPTLASGNTPLFKFIVTNTGNVALTNLVVSDDKLDLNGALAGTTVTIANLAAAGDPGDADVHVFTVAGTWQAGQHTNLGTVTGSFTDAWGNTANLTDSDAANYFGTSTPRLDIEKTTNGSTNSNVTAPTYDNEDTADGAGVPILTVGSTVTWTYKVTNTGDTALDISAISIVDDNGTPGVTSDDMSVANGRITLLNKSGADGDNLLEAGEFWIYQATGTVQNLSTPGAATTFDFSGNSATDGTDGNERSYTSGGISVKATAFSRDKSSGVWSDAFVGAFGSGLGVTDSSEGNGGNLMHMVDNVGRDNYVLFRFNSPVVVDSAFLGSVDADSDMTVWIGNVANAFTADINLSDSLLAGLGFTEVNLGGSSARLADLNAGNLAGNIFVVAARTGETSPCDRFKIDQLTVRGPGESGVYTNVATVSAPGAIGDSDASSYRNPGPTRNPAVDIEKLVSGDQGCTFFDADTGMGPTLLQGTNPVFKFVVKNTGDVALTNLVVSDDRLDLNGSASGTTITIGSLAVGASHTFCVTGTWQAGQHTNIATVTTTFTSGGTSVVLTDSDAANYFGQTATGPGVGTPGFWGRWTDLWDGDASAPRQAGSPGFAAGDVLFMAYGATGGPIDPVTGLRTMGLLIGDYNKNGRTDSNEETIFYTVSEALTLINASNSAMGSDARLILDRQLVATWLNFMAGNPLEAADPTRPDLRDAVDAAIDWLQLYTTNEGGVDNQGDGMLTTATRMRSSSSAWNNSVAGLPAGNTIKDWLDEYNNNGTVLGTQIAFDRDMFG